MKHDVLAFSFAKRNPKTAGAFQKILVPTLPKHKKKERKKEKAPRAITEYIHRTKDALSRRLDGYSRTGKKVRAAPGL